MRKTMAALSLAVFMTAPAGAKGSMNANNISTWIGTWHCVAGKTKHTAIFSSILAGKAMQIVTNGANASYEQVYMDTKRSMWIDEYVDASGPVVFEGKFVGNRAAWTSAYPAGANLKLLVVRASANQYWDDFTAGGKTSHEVCTR